MAASCALLGQRMLCDERSCPDHVPVQVPEQLLLAAAVHADEATRLDALALACNSPRAAALPGASLSRVHVHGPYSEP